MIATLLDIQTAIHALPSHERQVLKAWLVTDPEPSNAEVGFAPAAIERSVQSPRIEFPLQTGEPFVLGPVCIHPDDLSKFESAQKQTHIGICHV